MARGLYFSLAHGWKWLRAQPRSLAENRPRGFGSGRPAGTRAPRRKPGESTGVAIGGVLWLLPPSCHPRRAHATVGGREAADFSRPRGAAIVPTGPFFRVTTGRPGTKHAARGVRTRHPTPSTRHPAPGTRHSALGTRHPAPARPARADSRGRRHGDSPAALPGRPPGTGSAVARYGETPVPLLPRSRNPRDTATAGGSTAPPPRRADGRHHRSDLASHGRGGGGVRRTDHRTPTPTPPPGRPAPDWPTRTGETTRGGNPTHRRHNGPLPAASRPAWPPKGDRDRPAHDPHQGPIPARVRQIVSRLQRRLPTFRSH